MGKNIFGDKMKNKKLITALFGVSIGFINGLMGAGGGMLAVPLFVAGGMQEKRAHATAILVILPISVFSFILYAVLGFYQAQVLIPTAIGVTAGGIVGAQLLGKLKVKSVNIIFACLQFLAGAFLFFFAGK